MLRSHVGARCCRSNNSITCNDCSAPRRRTTSAEPRAESWSSIDLILDGASVRKTVAQAQAATARNEKAVRRHLRAIRSRDDRARAPRAQKRGWIARKPPRCQSVDIL